MDLDDTDFWTQLVDDGGDHSMHQFPTLNYVNQGILVCDESVNKGALVTVDQTYCTYNYPANTENFTPLTDQDILDNFDPSKGPAGALGIWGAC